MNNKEFEKTNLTIKYYTSSLAIKQNFQIRYLCSRIPIFFNLYENRFLHYEFLKEIFLEVLESKQVLTYNFQDKLFSLYNRNKQFSLIQISYFYKAKVVLLMILVILLVRSFNYKSIIRKNKNISRLYGKKLFKICQLPLSFFCVVLNKFIRKLKLYIYLIHQEIRFIFFKLSRKLFLSYLDSIKFKNSHVLNSQNCKSLVNNFEFVEIKRFYDGLIMFLICLFFKEYILVNRVFKQFNHKVNIIDQKN